MKTIFKSKHSYYIVGALMAQTAWLSACGTSAASSLSDDTSASVTSSALATSQVTSLINDANTQATLAAAVGDANCAVDANQFGGMAIPFLPGAMNGNNLSDPNGMFSAHGFFGSHGFDPNRTCDPNHAADTNDVRDHHFPMPPGVDPNGVATRDPNHAGRPFPGVDPNGMFGNIGVDPNGIVIPGFDPNQVMDPNHTFDPNGVFDPNAFTHFFGDFNDTLGALRNCLAPRMQGPGHRPGADDPNHMGGPNAVNDPNAVQ